MSGKEVLDLLFKKAREQDRQEPVTICRESTRPNGEKTVIEDFYLGWEDMFQAMCTILINEGAEGLIEDLPDGVREQYQ